MKNSRGLPLNYNSAQHLLKNRRYIGEYTYRDIIIPDGIPAIVSKDVFSRVQDRLSENKKAPARHKAEDDYLLTTKLFCGYCGAYLCGESGTSRTSINNRKPSCFCSQSTVRRTLFGQNPACPASCLKTNPIHPRCPLFTSPSFCFQSSLNLNNFPLASIRLTCYNIFKGG